MLIVVDLVHYTIAMNHQVVLLQSVRDSRTSHFNNYLSVHIITITMTNKSHYDNSDSISNKEYSISCSLNYKLTLQEWYFLYNH
jgi:hypothetical protein